MKKIDRITGPFFSKQGAPYFFHTEHDFNLFSWNIVALENQLIFHLAISQHLSAVARLHFEISSNVENEKFQFDFLIHSFTKLLSFIL